MRKLLSWLLTGSLLLFLVPSVHVRAADAPDAATLLQSVVTWATARADGKAEGAWQVSRDGQPSPQNIMGIQTSGGDRWFTVSPDGQQLIPQAAVKGGELYVSDPAAGWQDAGPYPAKQDDPPLAISPNNKAFDFLGLAEQVAAISANPEVIGPDQVGDIDAVRIRVRPDANQLNTIFHRTAGARDVNPQTDAYMVDAGSFSYWVDGSGVVRKGSFQVHMLVSSKGAGGQETHDLTYGAAFAITPGAQSINWPSLPAAAAPPAPSSGQEAGANARYTVMVFMNGTDLESKDGAGNATKDLQEMETVGSTPAVNVVVETLGTKRWYTPGISTTGNQRWLVRRGGLDLVADNLGNKPLGDPATLTDFMTWAIQKYPADKYALVFWDHGGGPNGGYGFDELGGTPASLSLNDTVKAISDAETKSGVKLEVIGFDACLMGGIEMSSMLSGLANYYVASEEVEPGHGWWYTHILKTLNNYPTANGATFGRAAADSFQAQAASPAWQDVDQITLSVIDLSKVGKVATALEGLVAAAGPDVGDVTRLQTVLKARSKAEDYGNGHGALDLVDLGSLADGLAAGYGDAAGALQQAIKDAVLYKLNTKGKPGASGLSVYLPLKNKDDMSDRLAGYGNLNFSQAYRQFVARYADTLAKDTTKVEFTQSQPSSGGGKSLNARVKPEQAAEIDEIYSVVARPKSNDPNAMVFLGMDTDVQFDPATGELQDTFNGQSVTLNGHFVSMFYEGEAGDLADYTIPVRLNGQQMDLKVLFNYKTGKSEVIGGWPGIDPESGKPDKEIIKLRSGDKVTPLFYWVNPTTGKDGYEPGPEFVLKGPPRLFWMDMPAGDYLTAFYIVDTARNDSFSDFTAVHTDGPPNPDAIRVVIDDQELTLDVPPEVRGGRTLVPLRAIFEALGARVSWNGDTRTVTAVKGDKTIKLQIDNPVAQRNGKAATLDQAPVISGGRTLVPVRFVSESLGAQVIWDSDTRTVIIISQL